MNGHINEYMNEYLKSVMSLLKIDLCEICCFPEHLSIPILNIHHHEFCHCCFMSRNISELSESV